MLLAFACLIAAPAVRSSAEPAEPMSVTLERVPFEWGDPAGWSLEGWDGDANADAVAAIRRTQTDDLFLWQSGVGSRPIYSSESGDDLASYPPALSESGTAVAFITLRLNDPVIGDGSDLRVWTAEEGITTAFRSIRNAEMAFPAISGDGRVAVAVEIRPSTVTGGPLEMHIHRWTRESGDSVLAVLPWEYVHAVAVDADGSDIVYSVAAAAGGSFEALGSEVRRLGADGSSGTLLRAGGGIGSLAIDGSAETVVVPLAGPPAELDWPWESDPGLYVRDSHGILRVDPKWSEVVTEYTRPFISNDGSRIAWSDLTWTAAEGFEVVFDPELNVNDPRMTSDGVHWLFWLDAGPDGPGLYRYSGRPEPTPTVPSPTQTETTSPTPSPSPTLPVAKFRLFLPALLVESGFTSSQVLDVPWSSLPAAPAPVYEIDWSSRLGASGDDQILASVVDSLGNVYVAGRTYSDGLATGASVVQPTRGGEYDAFVAKIRPDGNLAYATYLGGSHLDSATGIDVLPDGDVVVAGMTASADFPTTPQSVQPTYGGGLFDAWIARLSSSGETLVFSSYLGHGGADRATAITAGESGAVFVVGSTLGGSFPTTPGSAFPGPPLTQDSAEAFVARLAPDGGTLEYATYLGGYGDEHAFGVDLDESGGAYVVGSSTGGSGFPTTRWAAQPTYGGGSTDGFVARLAPDGSRLDYASFVGGAGNEIIRAVAVDAERTAFFTGVTTGGFVEVVTPGAFQPEVGGGRDAFVGRIDPFGARLVFYTYFGGAGDDDATSIALQDGHPVVAGWTRSRDLPTSSGAPQPSLALGCARDLCPDMFLASLDDLGRELGLSTYLGGNQSDWAATAGTLTNQMWIAGSTRSPDAGGSGEPTGGANGLVAHLKRPSDAQPFRITTTEDTLDVLPGDGVCADSDGQCSLRAAVMESNALPGMQTVSVPEGSFAVTIPSNFELEELTGDLDIAGDLTIEGSGLSATRLVGVAGDDGHRVLDIQAAAHVTVTDLTVTGGRDDSGGAIRNFGSLRVERIRAASNVANRGGAIWNNGQLTLLDSVVTGNSAGYGGGFANFGRAVVERTTFTSNGDGYGGGVLASGDELRLIESTVADNTGTFGGGIIVQGGGLFVMERSTVSGNVAQRGGGFNNGGSNVHISNSTISGNSGQGGAIFNSGSVTVTFSTLAFNSTTTWGSTLYGAAPMTVGSSIMGPALGGGLCDGDNLRFVTSLGHNVATEGTCYLEAEGDQQGVQPALDGLADNGGPTFTHALRASSPAIDAGDQATCPERDQRGEPRPQGLACDAGSYESSVSR